MYIIYIIKSKYASEMYSNFIFNHIEIDRERREDETIKKEKSTPGGSQGLMQIREADTGFGDGERVVDELPALL
jgi:hypothetical protein